MRLMIYWRTKLISGSRQPIRPHTRQLLLWFSMGSWVRAIPYQNSHYFSSVAHFSMKTDLLFCWQKTTVLQPALCMPPVVSCQISITFFCVDRSHSESCTDCILRQLKMKIYWNTQACGFIKGEMFWYVIKDGGGEDMGTKTFFFWGGGWREFEKWWVHIFPYSESLKTLYWWRSEILEH